SGTLWTKIPLTDRTLRVAFDRNQFAMFVINELSAPDSAVRANRARHFRVIDARMHGTCLVRHRFQTGAIFALADLSNERPLPEQASERLHASFRLILRQHRFAVEQ